MTKHKKFALKGHQCKSAILALILAAILMTGFSPAGALAQCGGNHSGTMGGQQMMGSSGHMGSGQMGMQGTQTPVQPDPNAAYVAPVQPPVSGYTGPQDRGACGQMTGQGGMASGPSGHVGH
jgi:hypothetical protein